MLISVTYFQFGQENKKDDYFGWQDSAMVGGFVKQIFKKQLPK